MGSRQEGALWLGFTDLRCICLHFCYLRNGPKWCADPNRPGRRGDREGALVNPARRLGKVSPIHGAPASSEPDVDGGWETKAGDLGAHWGPEGHTGRMPAKHRGLVCSTATRAQPFVSLILFLLKR